jgi:aspartate beta-hydroxylase
MKPQEIALAKSGIAALLQGDAHAARTTLDKLLATGAIDATSCVALAYACRALQDTPAMHAAIERALALEPRNLRALIFKADRLHEAGDSRAASAFYLTAVKSAAQLKTLPTDPFPNSLPQALDHAQARCNQYALDFEQFLTTFIAKEVAVDALNTDISSHSRFAQSLDLLTGKKQRFAQQPRYYYFPELPQIQFFNPADFTWVAALEAQTDAIRAELLEVLKEDTAFKPYVEGSANRPQSPQHGMLNNPDWSAFYLWKNGEMVPQNAARCPKTMAAVANIPLTHTNNRSPSVLFSLLRPGAHIPAHCGFVNTRLICHLPLIVPKGCTFRVGNEIRPWVEGKVWLFDDTIEHEAWNESDALRVILLFEVWRPEITAVERQQINAMFDAIDAHSGQKPVWDI